MITRRPRAGLPSANAALLHRQFVRHAHELLYRAYQRLSASQYRRATEEHITGDLKNAIDAVLDERPKRWMIHYFAAEEAPVNNRKRKGKKRKKIDIQIVSSRFAPRARFAFEAKRLGRRHHVSGYLGINGLGRFIRGEYAAECEEAGMLGYVQGGLLEEWSAKLALNFAAGAIQLGADSKELIRVQILPELTYSFQSVHSRQRVGRPIQIFHTLLPFH